MANGTNPYVDMITPEDRRDMRTMMLLQTGLGLLSNNRAHINNRMNPANIIGSGFQGYQQGLDALGQSRMRQQQFQMQKAQFEAEQNARQQEISDKAYQRQLLRDANQTNWHPLGDAIAGGAPPLAPDEAEGLLPTRSGVSREQVPLLEALAVTDPQAAIKAALAPGATPEWKQVYNPGTGLMEWIPETGLQPGMPSAAPKTEKPSKPFPALDANGQPTLITPEQFAAAPPGTYQPIPSGLKLDVGPDGQVRFATGTAELPALTSKTTSGLQETVVGARGGLERLRTIQSQFRPEYQEIPTRLGMAWTGLKAKIDAGSIDPDERAALSEFSGYKRDASENISLYIKEMTGAQMSAAEAARLTRAVPNPGTGIADGDDPITFKSKLDATIRALEKAEARAQRFLQQGITDPEVMAAQEPLFDGGAQSQKPPADASIDDILRYYE